MRLNEKEFDGMVKSAVRRIPREIRRHLDNVIISVQRRPTPEILKEMGLPAGKTLLGVYRGVSLMNRSVEAPPLFPDTIFIFQEPLEDICETVEELEREIEITVVHEIAHALGMNEKRLAQFGYA